MTDRNTAMRRAAMCAAVVSSTLLLAACTGHKKDATQSAARVDGTEITVHQINYRLQRERGLRPDQVEAASRKVLEQLIDEQLFVDKAEKTKVDKQAGAVQAMDAARREVLARAYVEASGQSVAAPTDQAMQAYFDGNPALFTQRRIYEIQEYLSRVPEDKIPELGAMLIVGTTPAKVEAWFSAHGAEFRAQKSTRAAEQIPLSVLGAVATLEDGQGLLTTAGEQVHVTLVTSSRVEPVTFDKAKPAITQFLLIEARRKANEANLAALRTAAKIEYAPQYAALAASGPALATTKQIEATTQTPVASGTRVVLPAVNAASGVQVTLPTTSTSHEQVRLPTTPTEGVHVSLPSTPASSVEVRLPPQAATATPQK